MAECIDRDGNNLREDEYVLTVKGEHGGREADSGSIGRWMQRGRSGKLCGVAEPKS